MKTRLSGRVLLGLSLLPLFLPCTTLHAQLTKVFVSATGNDANDGARGTPKRTFQSAHDAVADGGQIVALDTSGYGPLNITKNLSITVPTGINAFVTVASGSGITINTGLRVTLRGLIIEATAPGNSSGVYANSVAALRMENCVITGFGAANNLGATGGLVINSSDIIGNVVLTDTVIQDCPGSGITHGIFGSPSNSTLLLERCRILSNGQGVAMLSNGRGTVRNSIVSNNTGIGIRCGGVGQSNVRVNVDNCAVTDNGTGIANFFANNVTVSNTSITGNTTGVTSNPITYGNNRLINNTSDGSMGTLVAPK